MPVWLLNFIPLKSHNTMLSYTEFAEKTLRDASYKITGPRMAVIEVLAITSRSLSPYKIAEIALQKYKINLDTVTIYRIIQVMEKLHLVHKVHGVEGYIRCEVKDDGADDCHHSFICRKCKKVQEVSGENLDTFIKQMEKSHKFKVEKHQLELSGLCRKCK